MKENKYDDPQFFEQYSKMSRSVQGLEGAGERPPGGVPRGRDEREELT